MKHCDKDGEIEGSIGESSFHFREIEGVIKSKVCLKPLVTNWSRSMISLFHHYQSGHLANDGGILNQPHAYLHAMEIIKSWREMQ